MNTSDIKLSDGGLDADAESHLWLRLKTTGDAAARNQLIEHHLKLVRIIAASLFKRMDHDYLDFRDLVQMGSIGLIESVERFDPAQQATFASYASPRIRGEMLNGMERLSEVHAQRAFRRKAREERVQSLRTETQGRGLDEAFQQMVDLAVGLAIGCMLEDTAMYVDESASTANLENAGEVQVMGSKLQELVMSLPPQERQVMRLHYFAELPMSDIARVMGISKGRVSQLHASAIAHMKQKLQRIGNVNLRI